MPGVVLSTEIIDDSPIKLLRGELAQMKKEALRELAHHFHQEYVPRRFNANNDVLFHHEKRNDVYKTKIKPRRGIGIGKSVNNVLTGKTKRRAALARVTATQHNSTLTVETPVYFRRPFKGIVQKENGRIARVDHQPDKVAETVRITNTEKAGLREKFAELMLEKIKNPPERKAQNRDSRGRFIKAT